MKIAKTQDELQAEASKHDLGVRYDGRTLVVTCTFDSVVSELIDPGVLSGLVRESAAGPDLKMCIGKVSRRADGCFVFKTFVNTDESVDVVAARCSTMEPRPARTECGVTSPTQARELWAALHFAVDGGD